MFVFSEAEICQLADIQDSIQRMREGDLCPGSNTDKQTVEARLSSSCPSLAQVDSGDEVDTVDNTPDTHRAQTPRSGGRAPVVTTGQRSGGRRSAVRSGRGGHRSPSVSTGDSDDDTDTVDTGAAGHGSHVRMGVAGPGLTTGHLTSLHKSVSTPSMVQHNDHLHHPAHHMDNVTPNNKSR